MKVHVNAVQRCYQYDVEPDMNVLELKRLVENDTGMKCDQQRLMVVDNGYLVEAPNEALFRYANDGLTLHLCTRRE